MTVNTTAVVSAADIIDLLPGTLTARGENTAGWQGFSESATRTIDNLPGTKWLDFSSAATQRASWLQYAIANSRTAKVSSYTLTSANDAPERDPGAWRLLGSNNGITWTVLDSQVDQVFAQRALKRTFQVSAPAAFTTYKLEILRVADPARAIAVQLAEWELLGLAVQ